MLSQKVKPGDFVELDTGYMGYIQNITWRHTTLMERTNNVVTVPNAKISAAIVKNYDKGDPSFSIRVPVGVSYDSNLDHVISVTEDVANSVIKDVDGANGGNFKRTEILGMERKSWCPCIWFVLIGICSVVQR